MRGLLRGRWNLWTWRNWKREDELRIFACERGTSARFHTRSVCTCEARLHLFTGTGCVFCVLCSNDRSGAGGRLAAAEGTDMVKNAKQKKAKRGAKKVTAKTKLSAKKKAPKQKAARRRPARQTQVVVGSQSVETVQLKRRARAAAAGESGGDFGGVSVVEGADSESPDELLEEGQTVEAGIVSGVEHAPDPDQGEVRTHEVTQDDVPEEYDDKDRP